MKCSTMKKLYYDLSYYENYIKSYELVHFEKSFYEINSYEMVRYETTKCRVNSDITFFRYNVISESPRSVNHIKVWSR